MAIVYKKIENQIEHIWYRSSNIFYTKTDLGKIENKSLSDIPGIEIAVPTVNVTVIFIRGAQYLYKNVEWHDYTSFREVLNRDDSESHGKAFNKFIKSYPTEKLEDMDMNELQELKNKFLEQDNIEKISFNEKVEECYNLWINKVSSEEIIDKFGQEVFDAMKILKRERLEDIAVQLKNKLLEEEDKERISKMSFEEKRNECYNIMINGNVTDEYLIDRYGKEVFDAADILEMEYYKNLE
jgi:hypothetical protein